jgi:hypothetical protein
MGLKLFDVLLGKLKHENSFNRPQLADFGYYNAPNAGQNRFQVSFKRGNFAMKITPTQVRQFRESGYFITDVVFDAATLDGLRSEFDRLWQAEIEKSASYDAKSAELVRLRPFIGHVHLQSDFVREVATGPVFQEICRALIGPDADLYYNQAVLKPPGKGKAFGWHQDTQYIITQPLEYVTCWLAVADATVENGTIWIVPELHKQGLLPHIYSHEQHEWQCQFDASDKIPVELKAGQMAVFSSLLPHSSGPNTSDTTRYAYVAQYHVPRVTQRDTGELVGDQFPVLRNNHSTSSQMTSS